MENKYYIPNISELFIGYELESKFVEKDTIWWESDTISSGRHLDHFIGFRYDNKIRTKVLDSDDIISLGFNKIADNRYELICDNKGKVEYGTKFYIELYYPYETPWITITHEPVIWCSETISYIGRCKSKNELKTILSWIK